MRESFNQNQNQNFKPNENIYVNKESPKNSGFQNNSDPENDDRIPARKFSKEELNEIETEDCFAIFKESLKKLKKAGDKYVFELKTNEKKDLNKLSSMADTNEDRQTIKKTMDRADTPNSIKKKNKKERELVKIYYRKYRNKIREDYKLFEKYKYDYELDHSSGIKKRYLKIKHFFKNLWDGFSSDRNLTSNPTNEEEELINKIANYGTEKSNNEKLKLSENLYLSTYSNTRKYRRLSTFQAFVIRTTISSRKE